MKVRYLLLEGLICALCISLVACNKENNENDNNSKHGVAIESISAVSEIDLSGRSGWLFRVGYGNLNCVYYDYTMDGNKLHAFSQPENAYRLDPRWKEGDVLGLANRIVFYFQDKRYYYSTSTRAISPEVPDIADQSTEELFLIADRLVGDYTGEVKRNISDMKFIHANILIEFEIKGIDQDAAVWVGNSTVKRIFPLKIRDNFYKAIIPGTASIYVKVGNDIGNILVVNKFSPNSRYTIKAHWDEKSKKLLIDDNKREEWI